MWAWHTQSWHRKKKMLSKRPAARDKATKTFTSLKKQASAPDLVKQKAIGEQNGTESSSLNRSHLLQADVLERKRAAELSDYALGPTYPEGYSMNAVDSWSLPRISPGCSLRPKDAESSLSSGMNSRRSSSVINSPLCPDAEQAVFSQVSGPLVVDDTLGNVNDVQALDFSEKATSNVEARPVEKIQHPESESTTIKIPSKDEDLSQGPLFAALKHKLANTQHVEDVPQGPAFVAPSYTVANGQFEFVKAASASQLLASEQRPATAPVSTPQSAPNSSCPRPATATAASPGSYNLSYALMSPPPRRISNSASCPRMVTSSLLVYGLNSASLLTSPASTPVNHRRSPSTKNPSNRPCRPQTATGMDSCRTHLRPSSSGSSYGNKVRDRREGLRCYLELPPCLRPKSALVQGTRP